MKKISLIIIFVLFSFVSISAQKINGKEIKNRDIEWSDFAGEVDAASRFDALTNWIITYAFSSPSFKNGAAQVRLTTKVFLRSDSWVKPNKATARLLNHERGHFKIGKICAREIEQTVNSMSFDRNDYAKQIDAVYWKIINKYVEIEKQYDSDTEHYNNQAQQEAWDKKLNDALNQ